MSNQETGYGTGVTEPNSPANNNNGIGGVPQAGGGVSAPTASPNVPNQWGEMPGGGTYTDSSGRPSSGVGVIDQPGDFQRKLNKIGGGGSTSSIEQRLNNRYAQQDIIKAQIAAKLLDTAEIQGAKRLLESKTAQWAGRTQEEKDAIKSNLYYQTIYRSPETQFQTEYDPDYTQEVNKYLAKESIRDKAGFNKEYNPILNAPQIEPKSRALTIEDYIKRVNEKIGRSFEDKLKENDLALGKVISENIPNSAKNFLIAVDRLVQKSFTSNRFKNPFALRNVAEDVYNIEKGAIEGIANKPAETVFNTAVMVAITKGSSVLASKVPFVVQGIGTGKIAKQISIMNVATGGLAAIYGADVIARISSAENKASKFGEILGTEGFPIIAGAKLASIKPGKDFARYLKNEDAYLNSVDRAKLKATVYEEANNLRETSHKKTMDDINKYQEKIQSRAKLQLDRSLSSLEKKISAYESKIAVIKDIIPSQHTDIPTPEKPIYSASELVEFKKQAKKMQLESELKIIEPELKVIDIPSEPSDLYAKWEARKSTGQRQKMILKDRTVLNTLKEMTLSLSKDTQTVKTIFDSKSHPKKINQYVSQSRYVKEDLIKNHEKSIAEAKELLKSNAKWLSDTYNKRDASIAFDQRIKSSRTQMDSKAIAITKAKAKAIIDAKAKAIIDAKTKAIIDAKTKEQSSVQITPTIMRSRQIFNSIVPIENQNLESNPVLELNQKQDLQLQPIPSLTPRTFKSFIIETSKNLQKPMKEKYNEPRKQKPTKEKIPEKPEIKIPMTVRKFSNEVEKYKRKKKKSGRYVWNITNPVPDFFKFING